MKKIIYYLIIILLCIGLIYIYFKYIKEGFDDKTSVPLKIFQTWHTKNLPPKMKKCNDLLKKQNPEFMYSLYDDKMCRKFIQTHFDQRVVKAFDTLRPGAYKADLWRYCVLYKEGGIYIDIKYSCSNNFKLIKLIDNDYFVQDREPNSIYNGFIVCKTNNPIFLKLIKKICNNCEKKKYSDNSLGVTGPTLFYKYFTKSMIENNVTLQYSNDGMFIYDKKTNKSILKIYSEYRTEQTQYKSTEHYGKLWNDRNIYNSL